MNWLEKEDAVRPFLAFDGTEVEFNHLTGQVIVAGATQPSSACASSGLDWTAWQNTVNARERVAGLPLTIWSQPSDRGDGTFDDGPFDVWPEETCESHAPTPKKSRKVPESSLKRKLHSLKLDM